MSGFRANREILTIFTAKLVRTFCYGYLGILLPLYLADLGLSASGIGASVTMTLVGSALLTWAVRARPSAWASAQRSLGLPASRSIAAAMLLATRNPCVVVLAAMLGNIAVGAGETGHSCRSSRWRSRARSRRGRRTTVLSVVQPGGLRCGRAGGGGRESGIPAPLFAGFLAAAIVQGPRTRCSGA